MIRDSIELVGSKLNAPSPRLLGLQFSQPIITTSSCRGVQLGDDSAVHSIGDLGTPLDSGRVVALQVALLIGTQ